MGEDVLRLQAEVISAEKKHDALYMQSTRYQQPRQVQRPTNFQPQQQQQLPQDHPQVPGLQQLQQQRQALLAVELNHEAAVNKQPPQFQQQPQFQQPTQQNRNSIPGLELHAKYVADLQAAQT